jgi:nucleotide-binding universal stress UspA family protein
MIPLSVGLPEPSVLGHPIVREASLEEIRTTLAGDGQSVLDAAISLLEGVDAEPVLVEDAPARALVRAASDADLLVVGSRGRGGFKGVLLGSVSQQCARQAPCPLVIVPHAPTA